MPELEDLTEERHGEDIAGASLDGTKVATTDVQDEGRIKDCSSADDESKLALAREAKERGNIHFKSKEYDSAIECYSNAIDVMPPSAVERAVFFANRAACFAKLNEHEAVIDDCTQALQLQPQYTKALMRRALAKEALDQPTEALEDARAALSIDSHDKSYEAAVARLETASAAKLEQQKEEMLGKLKDLGNSVLGKFGMSLDNFKAEKDPNTGSYNISFNR